MLGLLFRIVIYLLLGVGRILLIRNGKSGIERVYLVIILGGLVVSEGGAGWKRPTEVAMFRVIWWSALLKHERRSSEIKQERHRIASDWKERDIPIWNPLR